MGVRVGPNACWVLAVWIAGCLAGPVEEPPAGIRVSLFEEDIFVPLAAQTAWLEWLALGAETLEPYTLASAERSFSARLFYLCSQGGSPMDSTGSLEDLEAEIWQWQGLHTLVYHAWIEYPCEQGSFRVLTAFVSPADPAVTRFSQFDGDWGASSRSTPAVDLTPVAEVETVPLRCFAAPGALPTGAVVTVNDTVNRVRLPVRELEPGSGEVEETTFPAVPLGRELWVEVDRTGSGAWQVMAVVWLTQPDLLVSVEIR